MARTPRESPPAASSTDQSTQTTMPTEWARVDAALDELLSLPPTEWGAAIERIAQGDAALADELHSLLAAAIDADEEITGGNGLTGARPPTPDDLPLDPARYRELDAKVARALASRGDEDDDAGPRGGRRVERRAVPRTPRTATGEAGGSASAGGSSSRLGGSSRLGSASRIGASADGPDSRPSAPPARPLGSAESFAASRRAHRRAPRRRWGVLLAVTVGVVVAMVWRTFIG